MTHSSDESSQLFSEVRTDDFGWKMMAEWAGKPLHVTKLKRKMWGPRGLCNISTALFCAKIPVSFWAVLTFEPPAIVNDRSLPLSFFRRKLIYHHAYWKCTSGSFRLLFAPALANFAIVHLKMGFVSFYLTGNIHCTHIFCARRVVLAEGCEERNEIRFPFDPLPRKIRPKKSTHRCLMLSARSSIGRCDVYTFFQGRIRSDQSPISLMTFPIRENEREQKFETRTAREGITTV